MEEQAEQELFWLNESKAIWNYELAVGDESTIVAVQPRPYNEWIYIELEAKVNECPNTLE